jgi:hypothetical protein
MTGTVALATARRARATRGHRGACPGATGRVQRDHPPGGISSMPYLRPDRACVSCLRAALLVLRDQDERGGTSTIGRSYTDARILSPTRARPPTPGRGGTRTAQRCQWVNARYSCTDRTAADPSPTADATRLVEPERRSPTANSPEKLVSYGSGRRPSVAQVGIGSRRELRRALPQLAPSSSRWPELRLRHSVDATREETRVFDGFGVRERRAGLGSSEQGRSGLVKGDREA